jgi:hypothetical protein
VPEVTRVRVALALALALAGAAPAAAQDAKSKCSAAKLQAVGAYYAALAKCAAQAVAKDQSLDPLCVTKAQVKLQDRFAKAERKDDCRTWRESVSMQEILDEAFADLLQILEPPPSVCCDSGPACFWVSDPGTCSGTVGAAGTVCSLDGCVAPPAAEGPCCEGVTIPTTTDTTCVASPNLTAPDCTTIGGTLFVPDAVCLPGRVCVD